MDSLFLGWFYSNFQVVNVSFVVVDSSSETCVKSFLDYFASLFHFRPSLRAVNVYFTFPVLFYSILREHEKSRTRSLVLFGILLGKSIIAFQVTVYLNLVRVRVNSQNTFS